MDLLSMLMNARIRDMDGDEIAEVVGVQLAGGKLYIMIDMELDDEDEGEDPDGGEEINEDEREFDNTKEIPVPLPLRAVSGGKK